MKMQPKKVGSFGKKVGIGNAASKFGQKMTSGGGVKMLPKGGPKASQKTPRSKAKLGSGKGRMPSREKVMKSVKKTMGY